MGAIRIPDNSWREDAAHDAHQQRLLDAYLDGHDVGKLGGAAGLCPQDFTPEEQAEWRRGRDVAIRAALKRRAA